MPANLRRTVLTAALAAVLCVPAARADEELEQRRTALEQVLLQKGEMVPRGKAV